MSEKTLWKYEKYHMISVPETATTRRPAGRPRVIHQPASSPGLRPVRRAIGYVLVSSADQVANGFGLDAQRQAITAYATVQGWEVVSIEEDQGISGTYGVADTNRATGHPVARAWLPCLTLWKPGKPTP